jgi:hypothetical protein
MNVEGYIAERNIARAEAGYSLDYWYLHPVSSDAVSVILNLYQTTDSPHLRYWSGQWLSRKLKELDYQRATTGATLVSANLSRDSAWAALDNIRGSLPEHEWGYIGMAQALQYEEEQQRSERDSR